MKEDRTTDRDEQLVTTIGRKQARKQRARAEGDDTLARGLGASGAIGWSIAIPTLIGIAVGVWLDARRDESISWTLTLLGVGLGLGCLSAYHWFKKETGGD